MAERGSAIIYLRHKHDIITTKHTHTTLKSIKTKR
nr:MAG TPA: hypothetical protein [Caudoviricetes sp.]